MVCFFFGVFSDYLPSTLSLHCLKPAFPTNGSQRTASETLPQHQNIPGITFQVLRAWRLSRNCHGVKCYYICGANHVPKLIQCTMHLSIRPNISCLWTHYGGTVYKFALAVLFSWPAIWKWITVMRGDMITMEHEVHNHAFGHITNVICSMIYFLYDRIYICLVCEHFKY